MSEKKITVKDFVKQYKKLNSDATKNIYIKSMIKDDCYIPYAVKIATANTILENSCFDKDGNIKFDSCKKYLMYVWAIFSLYTDIELEVKNIMDEYDVLQKEGLIDIIIDSISDIEKKEFDYVLKMRQDDFIANYCGLENYIERKLKNEIKKMDNGLDILLQNLSQQTTGENE